MLPRPLPIDVLAALVPLLAVSVTAAAGFRAPRWPLWGRVVAGVLCAVVGLLPIAGLVGSRTAAISEVASWLGGVTSLAALLAVFLVAVALGSAKRSIRPSILVLVLVVAGGVVLVEGASPLIWRCGAEAMWTNRPDGRGRVQQSTGMTCAAASGAMLLACHGIQASEGEVAHASGTSFFGTDQFELARGLSALAASDAHAGFATLDEAGEFGRPFVAFIWTRLGRHAVLVARITTDSVDLIDPRFGSESSLPRRDFEEMWSGIAVWIGPNNSMDG